MGGVNRGEGSEGREGWGRGGRSGVTDSSSEGAIDLGEFIVEGKEEGVTEVRGCRWVGVWRLEQFVDSGEQDAGVPVGAVDEGGEVGRFGSLESITVGGDVLFVGFGMNSEMGAFV